MEFGRKVMLFLRPLLGDPFRRLLRLPFRINAFRCNRSSQVKSLQKDSYSTPKPLIPSARLRTPRELVQFRRSRFVAHLNELSRRHSPLAPCKDELSELEKTLGSVGISHEERVLEEIAELTSSSVYHIPFAHPDRLKLTEDAIRRREPLIAGAYLQDDTFGGYVDLLMLGALDPFVSKNERVALDPNAYIVCEIKLSSLNTVDFLLQTAAYATMLRNKHRELGIQHPEYAYLCLGPAQESPTRLDFRNLSYFFERTKRDYISFLRDFDESAPISTPDAPLELLLPWKTFAMQTLEEKDSLLLIAGIRNSQIQLISSSCGVSTLKGFAEMSSEEISSLARSSAFSPVFMKLHQQARMQLKSRVENKIAYEKTFGKCRSMPPITSGDMFFDLEGYPLFPGGLEYLFGISTAERGSFQAWWAHSRDEEELAFIHLIEFISRKVEQCMMKLKTSPTVFHYGNYEIAALRRISLRTRSAEGFKAALLFESFIENDIFFDVYKFIRSELVIGDVNYSIKSVEKLVGVSREKDKLADAQSSVAMYHKWRIHHFEDMPSNRSIETYHRRNLILDEICLYNQQDCDSLCLIVDWLRRQFPIAGCGEINEILEGLDRTNDKSGEDQTQILPGACGRSLAHKLEDSMVIERGGEVSRLLIGGKTNVLSAKAKSSLSHLLNFHVRESNPARRTFRDRITIAASPQFQDLFGDEKCIVGMSLLRSHEVSNTGKSRDYIYRFNPQQPSNLLGGESVAFVISSGIHSQQSKTETSISVHSFMMVSKSEASKARKAGTIVLTTRVKEGYSPPSHGSIVSSDELKICDAPLRKSILRKAEQYVNEDFGETDSLTTAFLNRSPIANSEGGLSALFHTDFARPQKLASFLDSRKASGVFVIQGPPGSGKTSLAAEIICKLVSEHGKTVAVSSNSHAAIDNLLKNANGIGLDYSFICKIGVRCTGPRDMRFKTALRDVQVKRMPAETGSGHFINQVPGTSTGTERKTRQKTTAALIGATCYQLCREDSEQLFDFLFIDEASQVPAANFVAMSSCAKSSVLFGDQQQLEMPIKGFHHREVGLSCLAYMVGEGVSTVSHHHGIFLETSYRMSPKLCQYVSRAFYDNSLLPSGMCENNKLDTTNFCLNGKRISRGSGVIFANCDSEYERQSENFAKKWIKPAEVTMITTIVDQILGIPFTVLNKTELLSEENILVVAPYNVQVRALLEALPCGIRVGTVDKFQGQQAAVVIVSLCTGSPFESENDVGERGEYFFSSDYSSPLAIEDEHSRFMRKGLKFSLQKNRLNVAVSRAQCLAIVVGHSQACSGMPLKSIDDISVAALFEHLREEGK